MSKVSGNRLQRLLGKTAWEDSARVKTGCESLWTVDFGLPVGKDMRIAGKIAALNAISDIYVSIGIPDAALMILQISRDLDNDDAGELIRGVEEGCAQENVKVVGGHTVTGDETLIGLSVLGRPVCACPSQCRVGDFILISKKLGTGLITRGYYHGMTDKSAYNEAIGIMLTSNRLGFDRYEDVHAITDVTGFGLVGHLSELLGDKGAIIFKNRIPWISSCLSLNPGFARTTYIQNNYDFAFDCRRTNCDLTSIEMIGLCDPQTNGPVLLCVPSEKASRFQKIGYTMIGKVTEDAGILVGDEY